MSGYNEFLKSLVRRLTMSSPLVSEDVAQAAVYMLNQPEKVSIKALDVVPTGSHTPHSCLCDYRWTN